MVLGWKVYHAVEFCWGCTSLPRARSFREIVRDAVRMPVVLCSGYAEELLHEAGPGGQVIAFLRKPYLRADLARTLARALRRGPAG